MAESNIIKQASSGSGARIMKTGGILCAITAAAALLLAAVNSVTAPVIEKNNAVKTEAAMLNVMPKADSFEKIQ